MPEPLGRDPLLLDYDVLSSGRPEDMKWSDWAAMRSHTRRGIQALLAEVERLRTIAGPMERLEAWRQLDTNLHEFEADIASGNPPQYRVTLSVCGHAVTWIAPTLSAAIDGALNYRKDTP